MKEDYKNKNKMNVSARRGFTMIELLVVISILGILAAGVLAAIDPFEQLKKGRDTTTRDSVLSLHQAFIRYYGTHGYLPWDAAASLGTCGVAATIFTAGRDTAVALANTVIGNVSPATPDTTCVGLLEADGELKPGFAKAVGLGVGAGVLTLSTAKTAVSVCFAPASRSMYAEDSVKFTYAANVGFTDRSATTCSSATKTTNGGPASSAANLCYYCAM